MSVAVFETQCRVSLIVSQVIKMVKIHLDIRHICCVVLCRGLHKLHFT